MPRDFSPFMKCPSELGITRIVPDFAMPVTRLHYTTSTSRKQMARTCDTYDAILLYTLQNYKGQPRPFSIVYKHTNVIWIRNWRTLYMGQS